MGSVSHLALGKPFPVPGRGMWRARVGLSLLAHRGTCARTLPPVAGGGASTPAPHFCDSGGAAILPRVPSQPQVAGPVASPFREKCACRAAGILALSPSRGILPEEADQAAFHPAGSELGSPQVRAFSPSFWLEPGC